MAEDENRKKKEKDKTKKESGQARRFRRRQAKLLAPLDPNPPKTS